MSGSGRTLENLLAARVNQLTTVNTSQFSGIRSMERRQGHLREEQERMQMARQMREREEGARRQETRERTQNSAEIDRRKEIQLGPDNFFAGVRKRGKQGWRTSVVKGETIRRKVFLQNMWKSIIKKAVDAGVETREDGVATAMTVLQNYKFVNEEGGEVEATQEMGFEVFLRTKERVRQGSYRKRVRLEKKGIDGKIQSLKDTIAGMQIEVARLEAQRNRTPAFGLTGLNALDSGSEEGSIDYPMGSNNHEL